MYKFLQLFLVFFKIGAFTFGGGYAMIPLIEEEVVHKKNWISKEDFLDILAISQSFPGALAVNSSTFIGYRINGFLGALTALLGTILPSFFIILCIVKFFMQFRNNYYINLAFKGISCAVPVLILIAVFSLFKSINKDFKNIIIILFSLFLLIFLKLNPVFIIILSAIYGIIFIERRKSN